MLIRISLIIAIVAGLAAAVIGFMNVQEKIVVTMTERDDEKDQKVKAQTELASTKKTLKRTEEDLATTKTSLTKTKNDLQAMTSTAEGLQREKNDLTTELADVKGQRDDAQQRLVIWENVGLTPDQMKATIADLKTTREQKETFLAENTILLRENKKLNAKIDELIGEDRPVILPAGLKGKIVAVDPKYDFVVLNIGGNQGVLERGEMLVNRGGRLVAKVRIASVAPDRSVANILPGWSQAEVMEGDQVLY